MIKNFDAEPIRGFFVVDPVGELAQENTPHIFVLIKKD
jgi:hypothetical protein